MKHHPALTRCAMLAALAMLPAAQAWAQHAMHDMKDAPAAATPADGMAGMDHGAMKMDSAMPGMDHGTMKMDSPAPAMNHGNMDGMQGMGPMQGGKAPPDARDPDAYADGLPRMTMRGMDMADNRPHWRVLLNELEYAKGDGEEGENLGMEAWFGGDYEKLWLKAEGERRGGRLEDFRTELLWDHAIATFWSTQLGVRHDNGGGPARTWLAFGVQGLAPYWFETEATAYVGRNGSVAARLEARYELLLTQQWILEPKLEVNLYSKDDPERGIGSGLSDMEVGLRLRYEITREIAPYIGVNWSSKFGNTADYARQANEQVRSTQFVAGVRIWF